MEHINIDEEDLTDLVEHRRYVPNYDTEIYIQFDNSKFELGDYVLFKIRIVDSGIITLEKPYFYAFLVNPLKEAVLSFPDTIHSVSSHSKMPAWSTKDHYENFYRDCLHYQGLYLPRSTIIEGNSKYVYTYSNHLHWSESSEIVFQYPLKDDSNLIGNWNVYVFTYDEEYRDRLGNKLEALEANNFIEYSVAEFQVTAKSLPEGIDYQEVFNKYLISPTVFLITFALNYIGIYPLVEKHKKRLSRIWTKIREHWAFVVSLITIVIVQIILLL